MLTFAGYEFNGKRHKTRKEIFLASMEVVLPSGQEHERFSFKTLQLLTTKIVV
jgi:hypothetical protein